MPGDKKSLLRGDCFDISLELGPAGDDKHAREVLTTLWSYPGIEGPWRSRNHTHNDLLISDDAAQLLKGIGKLSISANEQLPFAAHLIREKFETRRSGTEPLIIENRGGFVLPRDIWNTLAPNATPSVLSNGLLYITPVTGAELTVDAI